MKAITKLECAVFTWRSVDSDVVGVIAEGQQVDVIVVRDDFARVAWVGGISGWVSVDALEMIVGEKPPMTELKPAPAATQPSQQPFVFRNLGHSQTRGRSNKPPSSAYSDKFPVLNAYKAIIQFIAWTIIVVGVIAAIAGSASIGLGALLFIVPAVVIASVLLLISDLVQVFVNIENHLDAQVSLDEQMIEMQQQLVELMQQNQKSE